MKNQYFLILVLALMFGSVTAQNNCEIIYVTPNGAGSGAAGTQANPASLQYGLTLLSTSSPNMRMADGVYTISNAISVPNGARIEGGFNALTWAKSNSTPTIISRDGNNYLPYPTRALIAIEANGVSGFTLQDLTIRTVDAPAAEISTYGVYLSGCSDYKIIRCTIEPGDGGVGIQGLNGSQGLSGSPGSPGNGFGNEQSIPAGGAGGLGANAGGAGGTGGKHSDIYPPAYGIAGVGGVNCGGGGGTPGVGPDCGCGLFGDSYNSGCSGTSPTGGQVGQPGANGNIGVAGAPGTIAGGYFVPGVLAGSGTDGIGGCGGGGGGGGGGRQQDGPDDVGGSGGGGGGGGYGGTGGSGGTGGGSSFAVFAYNNGANGVIQDCALLPGAAGTGGAGGQGGPGGAGGQGGQGGNGFCGGMSAGASGGNGGAGGAGGQGGAGADGMSVALSETNGMPVNASGIVAVPGNPPVITVSDVKCTNTTVTFTGSTAGSWNFGAGATPQTATGTGPHSVTYSTVGTKTINYDGVPFTDYINVVAPGYSNTSGSITASATTTVFGCPIDFSTSGQGATYMWDFGAQANPSTASTQSVSGVTFSGIGSRWVKLTISTPCCGTTVDSVQITTTGNTLTLTTSPTGSVCDGTPVLLTAPTGYNSYNFLNNGSSINSGTSNTFTVTNLNVGFNSFTVEVVSNGCTITSGNQVVTVNQSPTVDLGPDQQVCGSANVTLSAGSGSGNSYMWSNGATTQAVTVGTGEYIVTVTGSNQCSSIDTVSISASPPLEPEVMPSGTVSICNGQDVTLDAGNGYTTYDWSDGSTTQTITVSAAGTFTVTVTDANGCDGASQPVIVDAGTISSPSISPAGPAIEICDGQSVALSVPAGYTSYLWSNNATTQSIQVGAAGDYYVNVMQGNCAAVSDTVSVSLTSVSVSVSNNGNDLSVNGTYSSYQWYYNGTPITGATGPTYTITESGTYYVVVTDGSGCEGQSNVTELGYIGIDEVDFAQELNIYPNPTENGIVLEIEFSEPQGLTLQLTNILGQGMQPARQLQAAQSFRQEFDLTELPNGAYFLVMEKEGQRVTRVVMKK